MHKNSSLNSPYLVSSQSAQYYECSYSCDHALVLVCGSEKYFITDGRYDTEAKESVSNHTEVIQSKDLIGDLARLVQKNHISSLVFDSWHTNVADFRRMKSLLFQVNFEARENFHQELRKIKTQEEIDLIALSQELNKKAFEEFAQILVYCEGKNEKELHFKAQEVLSRFGQFPLSFDPILALNANGAKPHALPCEKSILQKGDWILFDAGIKYKEYCSDMTRCAFFGDHLDFFAPQKHPKKIVQKLYDIVKEAKEYTIAHLKEGMKASEVDHLARSVIEKRGYGAYFTHSTGHGIGLDIHELPRISPKSDEMIREGMVFSIEPGIYLPGEIGVRLEDLVTIRDGEVVIL